MSASQQLLSFLAKYEPGIARQAKQALRTMRSLVPGAVEMVYDNYNAMVIGFGPSEKASLAVFSLAIFPKHISLFFLQGAGLPDPAKRLAGQGTVARHVRLTGPETLDDPEIRALLEAAKVRAKEYINPGQKRRMVIKSISARQRPRRPARK